METIALPGYRILETLSDGSDRTLQRARREPDDHLCLLKILKAPFPTRRQIAPLRHELEITRGLQGTGVVRAVGLEEHPQGVHLVLENSPGPLLANVLAARRLSIDETLRVIMHLAETLGRLHQARIVHKDVQPGHVLVDFERDTVALTGFGSASLLSRENQAVRNPDVLEGALAYMSPEQTGRMNRAVDFRSDFYSLGVMLYRMLTGRLPFEAADPMELVHCHIARHPDPPHVLDPSVPQMVSEVAMKLLAKTGEERYQSAASLLADLRRCQDDGAQRFVLGSNDVSSVFHLPQQLYGRETELQRLLAAFDRVTDGTVEMVLVSGAPGIGKSTLVNEVHKPVLRERGWFISGKFDPGERNMPYRGVIQAFAELMRQLLTESPEKVERYRNALLAAFGPNGRVIVDVIPEVALIAGEQPPLPTLPPEQARNRFALVFQDFVRVFAQRDHPLVIFLDDLQWIDTATLQLLEWLMLDGRTHGLLVLGAYRDNEVSPAHPLMQTVEALQKNRRDVHRIELGPLSLERTNDLVADTLRGQRDARGPLSELLYRKTAGNPFFLNQILRTLHQDKLIVFDEALRRWTYELDPIREVGITENVVELMVHQLQRLQPETLEVLMRASCIGNRFDLRTLAVLADKSQLATSADLWEAIEAGLVVPTSDAYKYVYEESDTIGDIAVTYRFLHDRVQQATHTLLPEDRQRLLRLQLGRLLLRKLNAAELEERLFEVLSHLNFGRRLMGADEERRRLAELNLRAGTKARNSTAYEAACKHFTVGIELLPADAWDMEYRLAFPLHLELSSCECLCGRFEEAERLFAILLERVHNRLDAAQVCVNRILVYTTMNRLQQAIDAGLDGLRRLGLDLPAAPTGDDIGTEAAAVTKNLGGRKVADLALEPELGDPQQSAMVDMLGKMTPALYLSGSQPLMTLTILKMVNITLLHGNTDFSSHAYCLYGMILGSAFGDYDLGYQFGETGLRLNERFNNRFVASRLNHVFACFVSHWRKPLRHSEAYFLKAFEAGVPTGDVVYSGWAVWNLIGYATSNGESLDAVQQKLRQYEPFLRWTNDDSRLDMTRVIERFVTCLQRPGARLAGDGFDDVRYVSDMVANNYQSGLCWFYLVKARLAYLFEDYGSAHEAAEEAKKTVLSLFATVYVAELNFFESLVICARLPHATDAQRKTWLATLKANQEHMQKWADNSRDNYLHRYLLVAAEQARVENHPIDAEALYERAIAAAHTAGAVHNEALANELAARFHHAAGSDRGRRYLRAAHYGWARWGATARVAELEHRYGAWLAAETPGEATASALDLATVIKASQAISGEMSLSGVLDKVIDCLMMTAGAQTVVLMLALGGRLSVQASRRVDRATVPFSSDIESGTVVPTGIVRYVERTREHVVLVDARQGRFASDPYVLAQRPRSVLCAPILHQAQLLGIVYMENNLADGAFTPQRLEVLNVLSAQAAISIQNANLFSELRHAKEQLEEYSHALEAKVEERTLELINQNRRLEAALRQLEETQQQMITQQKMAYLGTLTAGIAHEIRNPLNFVRNFAVMSKDMVDTLQEDGANVKDTLETLRLNMRKVVEHSNRADGIVRSMLLHSSTERGEALPTALNTLTSDSLILAYRGAQPDLHVEVTTDLGDDLPDIVVVPQDISRALVNLINNALYTVSQRQRHEGPGFSPQVVVTTRRTADGVRVAVRDNGMGIANEHRDNVFSPFFTTKPPGEGTGLGLSISYDLVRAHGGQLRFESQVGVGSEFFIDLPARA